jgi:hypothetical protein
MKASAATMRSTLSTRGAQTVVGKLGTVISCSMKPSATRPA